MAIDEEDRPVVPQCECHPEDRASPRGRGNSDHVSDLERSKQILSVHPEVFFSRRSRVSIWAARVGSSIAQDPGDLQYHGEVSGPHGTWCHSPGRHDHVSAIST